MVPWRAAGDREVHGAVEAGPEGSGVPTHGIHGSVAGVFERIWMRGNFGSVFFFVLLVGGDAKQCFGMFVLMEGCLKVWCSKAGDLTGEMSGKDYVS